MTAHLPPYGYGKAIAADQIRILTLLPGKDTQAPIECKLETLPRDQAGVYTAISYCWGDPLQNTETITVNDAFTLTIREDVASALRQLRRRGTTRIWTDAICINQDLRDPEGAKDKNAQVANMDRTYKEAAEVVIWLGNASEIEESALAIQAIDSLGAQLENKTLKVVQTTPLRLSALEGGEGPIQYGKAILLLLQREWFDRLWVSPSESSIERAHTDPEKTVQEFCLAPLNVKLLCGSEEVAMEKLTNLMSHWIMMGLTAKISQDEMVLQVERNAEAALAAKDGRPAPQRRPPDTRIDHEYWARRSQEPYIGLTRQYFVAHRKGNTNPIKDDQTRPMEENCTLLSNLWNFRNRNCSMPVDRIYSLLGISSDVTTPSNVSSLPKSCKIARTAIKPDYTLTAAEVFVEATHAIIRSRGKLAVLGMCQGDYAEDSRPSWAPNFHLDPKNRPRSSLTVYSQADSYYKASAESVAIISAELSSELRVFGYPVGIVKILPSVGAKDAREILKRSRVFVQGSAEVAKQYTNVQDAFWRTLITNRDRQSKQATETDPGQEFDKWWQNIVDEPGAQSPGTQESYINYQSAWLQHCHLRYFFVTQTGYMGVGPLAMRPDDHICLLAGSQVPMVLRSVGDNYQVVGECYVHDAMDGTLWWKLGGGARKMEFRLI